MRGHEGVASVFSSDIPSSFDRGSSESNKLTQVFGTTRIIITTGGEKGSKLPK